MRKAKQAKPGKVAVLCLPVFFLSCLACPVLSCLAVACCPLLSLAVPCCPLLSLAILRLLFLLSRGLPCNLLALPCLPWLLICLALPCFCCSSLVCPCLCFERCRELWLSLAFRCSALRWLAVSLLIRFSPSSPLLSLAFPCCPLFSFCFYLLSHSLPLHSLSFAFLAVTCLPLVSLA